MHKIEQNSGSNEDIQTAASTGALYAFNSVIKENKTEASNNNSSVCKTEANEVKNNAEVNTTKNDAEANEIKSATVLEKANIVEEASTCNRFDIDSILDSSSSKDVSFDNYSLLRKPEAIHKDPSKNEDSVENFFKSDSFYPSPSHEKTLLDISYVTKKSELSEESVSDCKIFNRGLSKPIVLECLEDNSFKHSGAKGSESKSGPNNPTIADPRDNGEKCTSYPSATAFCSDSNTCIYVELNDTNDRLHADANTESEKSLADDTLHAKERNVSSTQHIDLTERKSTDLNDKLDSTSSTCSPVFQSGRKVPDLSLSTDAEVLKDKQPFSTKSSLKRPINNKSENETKSKKSKRGISFDRVSVYYFPRAQGFTCVPSQGGSTLGMSWNHTHSRTYSLGEEGSELRRLQRTFLSQEHAEDWSDTNNSSSDDSDSDEPISEADSESADNYCLQPLKPKDRRAMLRAAGVEKIDSHEKDECRVIRQSREICGCSCVTYCNPDTCQCALAEIKCQVDRLNFPCGCTRDLCRNPSGRLEFNPIRVRSHFVQTVMRLALENRSQEEQPAAVAYTSNATSPLIGYSSNNFSIPLYLRSNNFSNYLYQNFQPCLQQYPLSTQNHFSFGYNQYFPCSSPLSCQNTSEAYSPFSQPKALTYFHGEETNSVNVNDSFSNSSLQNSSHFMSVQNSEFQPEVENSDCIYFEKAEKISEDQASSESVNLSIVPSSSRCITTDSANDFSKVSETTSEEKKSYVSGAEEILMGDCGDVNNKYLYFEEDSLEQMKRNTISEASTKCLVENYIAPKKLQTSQADEIVTSHCPEYHQHHSKPETRDCESEKFEYKSTERESESVTTSATTSVLNGLGDAATEKFIESVNTLHRRIENPELQSPMSSGLGGDSAANCDLKESRDAASEPSIESVNSLERENENLESQQALPNSFSGDSATKFVLNESGDAAAATEFIESVNSSQGGTKNPKTEQRVSSRSVESCQMEVKTEGVVLDFSLKNVHVNCKSSDPNVLEFGFALVNNHGDSKVTDEGVSCLKSETITGNFEMIDDSVTESSLDVSVSDGDTDSKEEDDLKITEDEANVKSLISKTVVESVT